MIRLSPRGLAIVSALLSLILLFVLVSPSSLDPRPVLNGIQVPRVRVDWGEWTPVRVSGMHSELPEEAEALHETWTNDEVQPAGEDDDFDSGPQAFEGGVEGPLGTVSNSSEGEDASDVVLLKEEGSVLGSSSERKPCRRTFMIHLKGERGFGSEFSNFLRMAAVAEHWGYEVIVSHHAWMYGDFEQYFQLPERSCSIAGLPGDKPRDRPVVRRSKLVDGKPHWTIFDHVQDGPYNNFNYFDALFLSFATSKDELSALHNTEVEAYPQNLPLQASETVPKEMMKSFTILSDIARKWWNLNVETQAMVDALREELGWETPEARQDTIIIGMHIRLGDKCQELTNPSNGPLRFASPPVLAAKRPHSHCRTDHTQGKLDTATASTYLAATSSAISDLPRRKKTVLALMSDDVSVLEKLEQRTGVLEKEFDAILLPELAKGIPKAEGMTGGRDINALENGFLGNRYSDLSFKTRVALGRRFIRDLTLLAQDSDAFVFTGSSNVGRLAALLAGPEKAIEGRFISCDLRWYPTAHYN